MPYSPLDTHFGSRASRAESPRRRDKFQAEEAGARSPHWVFIHHIGTLALRNGVRSEHIMSPRPSQRDFVWVTRAVGELATHTWAGAGLELSSQHMVGCGVGTEELNSEQPQGTWLLAASEGPEARSAKFLGGLGTDHLQSPGEAELAQHSCCHWLLRRSHISGLVISLLLGLFPFVGFQ